MTALAKQQGQRDLVAYRVALKNDKAQYATSRAQIVERYQKYIDEITPRTLQLFEKVPRQPGLSAPDAAEIAAALWMGLVNNVEYDATLSDSRAERLFSRTVFSLAGLEPPARARARNAAPRIRVSLRRS